MDNNQPNSSNPWQANQNSGQSATPAWGASTAPNNSFGQAPAAQPGASSQSTPTPPTYQPPVSYGAINSQAAAQSTFNQATTPPTTGAFTQSPDPNQAQAMTAPTSNFGQATTPPSVPGQEAAATQNPQAQPTQPTPPASPDQKTQPSAKSKQPLSQNQILFIVTGLVSLVALAVIVICVVLVVS